ncbi:MAG: beta-lactamase family protein [Proteobacteria bacterium]|nr:beta-lactamase family protein [Pseudomonadota bacterium]
MTAGDRARAHLEKLIGTGELPGIQYAVLSKQGVVFEFNGGNRDVAGGLKVNADTTFLSSSSTKVITALAVLQLVDRGLVSLDDPLNRYFKGHPYGNAVTVRQLIIHTAGVPNPLPLDWFHPVAEHNAYDERAELARRLEKNPKLNSTPGTKYNYSNLGYWLLSKVIEHAAKMPYCDYVRQQILEPLGIPPGDLGCTIRDSKNHAAGYIRRFSVMRGLLWVMGPDFVMGKTEGAWKRFATLYMNGPSYGGLIGNARGWSEFLMDQIRDDSKVMSAGVKRLFYENQHTAAGDEIGMTLGWHTGVVNGHTYYSKPGGGPGYSSNIRTYPEKGLASVWLGNRMEASETPIHKLSDAIDAYFMRQD